MAIRLTKLFVYSMSHTPNPKSFLPCALLPMAIGTAPHALPIAIGRASISIGGMTKKKLFRAKEGVITYFKFLSRGKHSGGASCYGYQTPTGSLEKKLSLSPTSYLIP